MTQQEKKYGIGETQEILKKEFPDITISKIRFLEKEGLIMPQRTSSGYRKYTRSDIKLLRYILRLQREEYLPLNIIRSKIQDLEAGKAVAGDLTLMAGGPQESLSQAVPVSAELAPIKLQLSQEYINELIDYGLVAPQEGAEGSYFTSDDVKLLRIAREFRKYGIEPRHLRMFLQFSNREAALVEQIIKPQLLHKDQNARRSAIKDLETLIELCQSLSQALLRKGLSEYLPKSVTVELLEEGGLPGVFSDGAPDHSSGPDLSREPPGLSGTGRGARADRGADSGRHANQAAEEESGLFSEVEFDDLQYDEGSSE